MELCIDHDGFSKELVEDVQGQATITISSNQGFPLNLLEGEIVIATRISFIKIYMQIKQSSKTKR